MAWKSVAINGTLANVQRLGRLQSPISQTLLAKSGTSTKRLLVKATRWWNHCRKQHKHRFSPNLMDKPNVCCSLCMSLAHQHLFWLLRSPKASSQQLVSWCHVPISSFSWIIWSLSGRVSSGIKRACDWPKPHHPNRQAFSEKRCLWLTQGGEAPVKRPTNHAGWSICTQVT